MENNYFCIADHIVCIRFADSNVNSMDLLPSFTPFRVDSETITMKTGTDKPDSLLFTLTVDDKLLPIKERKLVRKFDTGNGDTLVYQLPDGGYQYIIRDIADRDCCLLICNQRFNECQCALNGDWTMRSFGLNDALMLIFAFAGSFHQTLLIHASCIMVSSQFTVHGSQLPVAFPFTAKSGTGKSTHTSLWLKHIEGAELLNDDNPIIRILDDGQPYVYGSPWSGKTPCYRNVSYPLGGIVLLHQAPYNKIRRLTGIHAYASLVSSISGKRWDERIADGLHQTENVLASSVPMWYLECLPDEAAAVLCCTEISKEQ